MYSEYIGKSIAYLDASKILNEHPGVNIIFYDENEYKSNNNSTIHYFNTLLITSDTDGIITDMTFYPNVYDNDLGFYSRYIGTNIYKFDMDIIEQIHPNASVFFNEILEGCKYEHIFINYDTNGIITEFSWYPKKQDYNSALI